MSIFSPTFPLICSKFKGLTLPTLSIEDDFSNSVFILSSKESFTVAIFLFKNSIFGTFSFAFIVIVPILILFVISIFLLSISYSILDMLFMFPNSVTILSSITFI